ncbi:MAG TPA: putative metalloprotease CJM1_0395 family protein [Candidatus Kapabacteria bacterium]|nr:putative metalloprotease CJM1_0395 family protein [Candidatus Kapabacteria bacterium]
MMNVANISNQTPIPAIESVTYNFDYTKTSTYSNSNSVQQTDKTLENKEDTYSESTFSKSEDTDYTKQLKNKINKNSSNSETNNKGKDSENSEVEETAANGKELSEEEKKAVDKLKEVDKKVRTHEQAHKSAGGGLVRGSSFDEKTGPDGKKYVTGGEVQIDISEVPNNPRATVIKMEQVIRAALAPADPSAQDRMVAAKASAIAAEARAELYSNNAPSTKSTKSNNPLVVYKNSESNSDNKLGKILDISFNGETTNSLKGIFNKE